MLQDFRGYSKNVYFEFIDPLEGKNNDEVNNILAEFVKRVWIPFRSAAKMPTAIPRTWSSPAPSFPIVGTNIPPNWWWQTLRCRLAPVLY